MQMGLLQKTRGKSEEDIKEDETVSVVSAQPQTKITKPLANSKSFKQIFAIDKTQDEEEVPKATTVSAFKIFEHKQVSVAKELFMPPRPAADAEKEIEMPKLPSDDETAIKEPIRIVTQAPPKPAEAKEALKFLAQQSTASAMKGFPSLTKPLTQVSFPNSFAAKKVDVDVLTHSSSGEMPSVQHQFKRLELLSKIQSQLNQIKRDKPAVTKLVGQKRTNDAISCDDKEVG
jgi:hypothetical protein